MKFPLLILAATATSCWPAISWIVGATRPYPFNDLQTAISTITSLSDDIYIFVEEQDLLFDRPLNIMATPAWNGHSVHVKGGRNMPRRVAYLGDEVHEMTPDGMQFEYVNLTGPLGTEGRAEGYYSGYHFYLKDHLGSTRAVLKEDRTVAEAYMYYSHGKQSAPLIATAPDGSAREKFTGKELDQDGAEGAEPGIELNYFGARYYDPDIGMWISPDPARQFASAYANSGNPINSVDPDGLAEYTVLDENGVVVMNWFDENISDRRSMVFQNGKLMETGQIAPRGWTGADAARNERSWDIIGLRYNFHYNLLLESYERRFMEAGYMEGMLEFRGGGSFDFKYSRTSLEPDLGLRRSLDVGMAYGFMMNSRDAGNTFWGKVVTDKYGEAGYWNIAKPLAGMNELVDRPFSDWGRQIDRGHMGEDPNTGRMNDFGSSLSR